MTMKVARYYAPEDLRIEDATVPEPAASQLLLEVPNRTTCGTDVKIYYHRHPSLEPPPRHGPAGAGAGPGDDVVVVGAGPIGCLRVRLAGARGAARMFVVEQIPERLALAVERVQPDGAVLAPGQDPVAAMREFTEGRGADVVLVAA